MVFAAQCALDRFGDDQRILSFLAIAYEMLGQTGTAFSMLEQAMAADVGRVTILRNYMSIALRLGRIDCVRQALDRLLEMDAIRDERIELMRLRALVHCQDGNHGDARRLVMEIGRVIDQASEEEEGMFLNLFMAVTLDGPPVDVNDAREMSRRVDAFCSSWPESRLFRKVEIPAEGIKSIDDLHRFFDCIVGGSRARMQEFEKRERQLHSGELPIPFILRPGYALHYVGNPFDLWVYARSSKSDAKQLHLQCDLAGGDLEEANLQHGMPMLDLTALLVLDSLNLFDILFSMFDRIAIPKLTIAYVSQYASRLMATGPGLANSKSILESINRWLDRIDQPGLGANKDGVLNASEILFEYVQLIKSDRWIMYCDDGILRVAMKQEDIKSRGLTTTRLLELADNKELLSPSHVARCLGCLVTWNVLININNRYLIASLEGASEQKPFGDAVQRRAAFEMHAPFTVLMRALACPEKNSLDLVQHMGQLLISMLQSEGSEIESIVAIVAFWFNRVRMFRQNVEIGLCLLGYPIIFALSKLPDSAASRTVGVMRSAVELCLNEHDADIAIKNEIPAVLGAIAGSLAKKNQQLGESVRRKLLVASPHGTAEGDKIFASYIDSSK